MYNTTVNCNVQAGFIYEKVRVGYFKLVIRARNGLESGCLVKASDQMFGD